MTNGWIRGPATEVAPGDRVRLSPGQEMTATRVETAFMGMDGLVAFIEDTPERWFKQPVAANAQVERRPPDRSASIFDAPIRTLSGEATTLGGHLGKVLLIVNVASKCGLTPHYQGLERLHMRYAGRGFAVLGFPCNQFGGQEPGTAEDIQEFCSTSYSVSFPLYEKVDVNGAGSHPIFKILTATPDGAGVSGEVQWNFEKFIVSPAGDVIGRFRPRTEPESADIVETIERALPE